MTTSATSSASISGSNRSRSSPHSIWPSGRRSCLGCVRSTGIWLSWTRRTACPGRRRPARRLATRSASCFATSPITCSCLTATPHKGDPANFSLFLQLLDVDAYADVKSIREAMDRRRAPFYLRRTKEAMVYFPERQDDGTWVAKKIFTKRIPHTVDFQIDGRRVRPLPRRHPLREAAERPRSRER